MIENTQRNARFTASNITRLLAKGGGATRMSYILEVALAEIGITKDFDNADLRHGSVNQHNAFSLVVKPNYPSSIWYDEFIPMGESGGASPDVLIDGHIPLEVKSPVCRNDDYSSYFEQIARTPKKYYDQVQCQMLVCEHKFKKKIKTGFLCFYLTKPETWAEENWEEFPYPLQDRYHIEPIQKDDERQYDIVQAIEAAIPVKKEIVDKLKAAKVIEPTAFFAMMQEDFRKRKMRFKKVKEASNILAVDFIRVGNEFYYEVR